ncbi:MAG: dihydropteroate synthase [Chthoniobacterales bacterium]|nr:dihydropteroate synthase [Chthoniobacterales bacterium]
MGILNVTPDSFSDGGRFAGVDAAVAHALRMVEEGAEIIDVGGESTRPGAEEVPAKEEISRVIPVIKKLRERTNAAISIDTSKAEVARAAAEAGAEIINDVTALTGDPGMAAAAAETKSGVVLMHMRGNPRTMQQNTSYLRVVTEVANYLTSRVQSAVDAGLEEARLAIDPGIGFGKTAEQNWALIDAVKIFATIGRPVLLGVSRKSFLAEEAGDDMEERDAITARLTALGFNLGARIFRVHEIPGNLAALRTAEAVWSGKG